MSEKLIIENRTDLSMAVALELAREIVQMGRISNDGTQYCLTGTFTLQGVDDKVFVSSFKNKKSDRLVIHYNKGD